MTVHVTFPKHIASYQGVALPPIVEQIPFHELDKPAQDLAFVVNTHFLFQRYPSPLPMVRVAPTRERHYDFMGSSVRTVIGTGIDVYNPRSSAQSDELLSNMIVLRENEPAQARVALALPAAADAAESAKRSTRRTRYRRRALRAR